MNNLPPEIATEVWKKELRNDILASISGNSIERKRATERVGYTYLCVAPASLYKYYRNPERDFATVKNNTMWYSAPVKCNDIFDSDFSVDVERVFNNLLNQIPEAKTIRPGSKYWKDLRAKIIPMIHGFKQQLVSNRETTGIACFSESESDLLMWAHYANHHQGICVEYELMRFSTELNYTPVPVVYSSKRSQVSSINLDDIESFSLSLLTESLTSKSPEWSYEKEWRIIRDSGACGDLWDYEKKGALLPSITPSSIILGCAVSDK